MPFNKQHYIVGTKITQTNLDFIKVLLGDLPVKELYHIALILFVEPTFIQEINDKLAILDFLNIIRPNKASLLQAANVYLIANNTKINIAEDVIYLEKTKQNIAQDLPNNFEILKAAYQKNFIQLIWDKEQTHNIAENTIFVTQDFGVKTLKEELLSAISQQKIAQPQNYFQELDFKTEHHFLDVLLWSGKLGIWDWNIPDDKMFFNAIWAEMLGFGAKTINLTYQEWEKLIHPNDTDKVKSALAEAIQKTDFYEIEHRKIAKNGEWKWLVATGRVVSRDENGKALRIVGIHQDITEKKKIEENAKLIDRQSKAIFETMQEGMVIQAMSGAIISCNRSAERILGLTYDQMIGRTSVDSRWRSVKEDGSPFPGEEHPAMVTLKTQKAQINVIMGVHKPNGSLTWISINSDLLYHPETNEPYAVFATFYDITETRNFERKILSQNEELAASEEELRANLEELITAKNRLQDSENKLLAMSNSTTDSNILISPNHTIISLNKTAEFYVRKLSKVALTEGMNVFELVSLDFKDEFLNYFNRALSGGSVLIEKERTFGNGIKVWFEMRFYPVYDAKDKLIGVSFNAKNIDIQKRTELKLKEKENKIRFLLDKMPVGVYTTDAEGYIDYFNQASVVAWGRTPEISKEQWCGSHKIIDDEGNIIPHEQCPMAYAIKNNVALSNIEGTLIRPNGEKRIFLVSASPFQDEEGKLVGAMNVMVDFTELKQITKELKENQTFLNNLIGNLPGYVYRVKNDKLFTPIYVSKQVINITGYTQDEYLIDKTVTCGQRIIAEDAEKVWLAVQESVTTHKPFECEYKILTKQGTLKWVWVRGGGVYNEKNELLYIEGFVSDITEKKKAEEKIKHNEATLNQARIGSWNFDLITLDVTWSRENYRIYELEEMPEDKLYEAYRNKIHPDDRPILDEFVQNAIEFGTSFIFEHRVCCDDGRIKYVEGISQVIKDAQGKVVALNGTVRDITEKKKTEQKIKDSEAILNQAQTIAKIGSWSFNLMTKEVVWSRETYRIFEISENLFGEELYLAYRNSVFENDRPILDGLIKNALETGNGYHYEHQIMGKDGTIKDIIGISEVINDAQGKPIALNGSVQDITERKKIENALAVERRKFQDIVDSTDGIVWEVDFATFQFTYVSQKAVRLLGFEVEEWYQPNFWVQHLHPEDKSWATTFCMTRSTALENHEFEYRFIAKDGREVWLRDIVTVVEENCKPKWLRGLMLDITEQKKVAQEKEELLERFEKIAANVPGVIYQYHAKNDGTISFPLIVGQVEELLGYSTKELEKDATLAFSIVHPDDIPKLAISQEISAKNLSRWKEEYRLQPPNKLLKWVEGNSTPKRMEDGSVMWYGYIANITERKKMEDELHRLSLVAQRTSNAVIITDVKRRIVWVNEGFTRITGYKLKEVYGKTPKIFQYEGTDPKTIQYINDKIAQQEPVKAELINQHKNGQTYWIDIEVQPLVDKQGVLVGFMAIQSDITARKNAEEEILKQNEKLKEIAFFQSHILRRPVANILGLINLIELEKDKPYHLANLYDYLNYLNEAAKNIDEAIHQIVDKVTEIDEEWSRAKEISEKKED